MTTYVCFWYLSESDICTILDNRVAGAAEIDIHVGTIVHAELMARHDDDAVFDAGDVSWSVDLTANQKTLLDPLNGEARVWLPLCGRYRHVHDTALQ